MKTKKELIAEKNKARLDKIKAEAQNYNKSEEKSDRYVDVKKFFEQLSKKSAGQQRSAGTVAVKEIDLSQNDREIDLTSEDFLALKESIKEQGLLQRPLVTLGLSPEKPFLCISGHRRILAYKELGFETVPAELMYSPEEQSTRLARLSENLIRQNLEPLELAEAVKRVKIDLDETTSGIARILNRDRKYLTELLKIADWPEEAKKIVRETSPTIYSLTRIAKRKLDDQELITKLTELTKEKMGDHPPKRQGASSGRFVSKRNEYFEKQNLSKESQEIIIKFLEDNKIKSWI